MRIMKRKLFEEVEGEENKVPTTSQGDSEKPEVTDQKSNSSEILQKLIDLMKFDKREVQYSIDILRI
jgi:hypothetical protein